ncbi:DNA breaking-rejoining enzyme [Suillus americanus]|nr:DNA breaking-rejoining enzyme [Suillus americanus]
MTSTKDRGTYGHAQKMRASMTYAFGKLCGLGNMHWHESNAGDGTMVGNPSISVEVSLFMCSLRRRKVQAGEVANSAHAITLLQAAYTVAFLCMLWFDEVLKIQVHDLCVEKNRVVLYLPFQKTHQNRDIKPFYLWVLPSDEAHICPARALAAWLCESKLTAGYLFRKVASGDCIAEANSPMSSEQFLELFRNNLLDINIDPAPYGTHSFHRGGCQYLHVERRWHLSRICEWGGWSTEFTNMTIVKYLISSNDDPAEPREHFFDPNQRPSIKCRQCGRCCSCA